MGLAARAEHIPDTDATFPNRFTNIPLYSTPPQPGVVDLHHLNALQRIEDGTGDYLVTARHLDAAFRVDRATENIDWYLGGAHAPCTNGGSDELSARHR